MSEQYIRQPLDQLLSISLSDDKLKAYLQFNEPDDMFTCTLDELEQFLNRKQVIQGIHYDVLSRISKEPSKFFYDLALVATGEPPTNGVNGSIEFMYDLHSNMHKPSEQEDGTVDYKDLITLNNVRKGQIIAKKIPPTEGAPGRSVTGEPIPATPGKEARFQMGKNVVVNDSGDSLYAVIDGLVTRTDRDRINVFPIYEVNGDVDYETGNIDFVGTVVIRGNVISGFKVKADGDIRVTGGVEGAELIAEGSIEINAGILGHNKGLIRAKRNVKCSFVQEGNIEAGEDVLVLQSIMHSRVRAGRDIICKGAKGLIVGGTIQAGEKVTARLIGNSMSTVTTIEVGVLPQLRNELTQLRAELKEHTENLDKSEKAINMLDQLALSGQLSPDRLAMKIKLSNTKKIANERISEIRERVLEIEKTLEDTSKAEVTATSTIYGGTKVVIGRYTRYIKDPMQHVTLRLVDGEIDIAKSRKS